MRRKKEKSRQNGGIINDGSVFRVLVEFELHSKTQKNSNEAGCTSVGTGKVEFCVLFWSGDLHQ